MVSKYQGLFWRTLNSAVLFEVSGRDCTRYLHNRLTQDINSLQRDSPIMAAALSAQGRVEGLFCVLKESCDSDAGSATRFLIFSDGGDRSQLLGVLRRFVVADRVNFVDLSSELKVLHIAANLKEPLLEVLATIEDRLGVARLRAKIERKRLSSFGYDLVVSAAEQSLLERLLSELLGPQLTLRSFDIMRWEAGCASFPDEINEEGMILEYGLRDAVSFSKGCYVGQEVVERSDAVGRVPRCLERLVIEPVEPLHLRSEQLKGASIFNAAKEVVGRVVGVIEDRIDCQDGNAESAENGIIARYKLFALLRNGRYQISEELICGEGIRCRIVR